MYKCCVLEQNAVFMMTKMTVVVDIFVLTKALIARGLRISTQLRHYSLHLSLSCVSVEYDFTARVTFNLLDIKSHHFLFFCVKHVNYD